MACGCKGGGKKSVAIRGSSTPNGDSSVDEQTNLVLMQYTGPEPSKVRLRSKVHPSDRYAYSKDESQFHAYQGDVNWLMSLGHFQVLQQQSDSPLVNDLAVLESNLVAPDLSELPLDVLRVDFAILAVLKKNGIDTVGKLRSVSDADLLSIKGLGSKRVKDLREALNAI